MKMIFFDEIYDHRNQNYDMELFDDDVLEMNNDDCFQNFHLLNYLMMRKILLDEFDDELCLGMKKIFLMNLRLYQILDDKKYVLV